MTGWETFPLQLHPLHQCKAPPDWLLAGLCLVEEAEGPLNAPSLAAKVAELAAQHWEETDCAGSTDPPIAISLDVEAGSLRVAELTGANAGRPLALSVRGAELAHAASETGWVLALVPGDSPDGDKAQDTDPDAWVFTLRSDAAVLLEVLDVLSSLGAIRAGLEESFLLTDSVLGDGSFATVYRIESIRTGVHAAAKVAKAPASAEDEELYAEAQVLIKAQGHAHVIGFLGLFRAPLTSTGCAQWAIALHLCPHGSLKELVKLRPLEDAAAAELMSGPLSGVDHLHKRGIVHRDIKAENILMAEDGRAIIADFGFAAFLSDSSGMAKRCGTSGYAAPEMLLSPFKYGTNVDVFAFGVTLFYLLFGTLPFQGEDDEEVCHHVVNTEVDLRRNRRRTQAGKVTEAFLRWLLTKSPQRRPSAAAALAHRWLAQRQQGGLAKLPRSFWAQLQERRRPKALPTCDPGSACSRLLLQGVQRSAQWLGRCMPRLDLRHRKAEEHEKQQDGESCGHGAQGLEEVADFSGCQEFWAVMPGAVASS